MGMYTEHHEMVVMDSKFQPYFGWTLDYYGLIWKTQRVYICKKILICGNICIIDKIDQKFHKQCKVQKNHVIKIKICNL
jgi:hypothetical protein